MENTYPRTDRHWHTAKAVTAFAVGAVLVWLTADALLLVFAAVLLAILLRTISSALTRFTGMPHGLSLAITTLGLLSIFGLLGWMFVPRIADQIQELRDTLPKAWARITAQLERWGWAQAMLSEAPPVDKLLSGTGKVFTRITGAVSGTLGALANLFIIFVLALFFAADPGVYVRGLIRLFPMKKRDRAKDVVGQLGDALRHWLIGQLCGMAFIGVLTGIGLAVIGVPLTLALTLLVVLLNFIPNLGPIIAGIPAVLLALTQSWQDALWVIALYLGAQTIEGNFFTPMVQRSVVDIPPAMTISAQLIFGLLFGFLGVALATPLAVAVMVLVRTLYIEDTLGDFSQ